MSETNQNEAGRGGAPAQAEYQQEVAELERQSATAARLFDIRRIIRIATADEAMTHGD